MSSQYFKVEELRTILLNHRSYVDDLKLIKRQAHVLELINQGYNTSAKIADKLDLTHQYSVTVMLRLYRKGYVTRTRDRNRHGHGVEYIYKPKYARGEDGKWRQIQDPESN